MCVFVCVCVWLSHLARKRPPHITQRRPNLLLCPIIRAISVVIVVTRRAPLVRNRRHAPVERHRELHEGVDEDLVDVPSGHGAHAAGGGRHVVGEVAVGVDVVLGADCNRHAVLADERELCAGCECEQRGREHRHV